ncbi:DUF5651 domain-containing protein [Veillonella sp. VA139]|uniref:DUF5651 domain-containing protein n=1 Tax=Veillonella sp. VA139 TaxID=741830 RepID=UPI000F8CAAC3|nr:DUF5651 domain-containing protein [Veillonella sp. VA139]
MSFECRNIVESFKLTGEAKRKANTMATFADWLIEDIRTKLDEEQQKQARRAATHYSVTAVQTVPYSKEDKQNEEFLRIIVDHALGGSCTNCTKEDFKACDLRVAFIHASVPVYDEFTEDCPYRIKE